jgi:hypothetical protein
MCLSHKLCERMYSQHLKSWTHAARLVQLQQLCFRLTVPVQAMGPRKQEGAHY